MTRRVRGGVPLLLSALLAMVLLVGVVRPFVAEPFRIPSESMAPTLQPGDSVLVTKLAYDGPSRGDVVAFDDGRGVTIKRTVGVAGDTVAVRDGVLFVDGEPVREPYVDYGLTDATFSSPVVVPKGHVFVMGDNRTNSLDSRSFGPIPRDRILGKVSLRLTPPAKAGRLPEAGNLAQVS